MKLGEIYKLAIKLGTENDLRGQAWVKETLKKRQADYAKLSPEEKKRYDTELLENPYPDSLLEFGAENLQVKKAIAGIDMESAEVLLAKQLGGIDLVIAHHPEGRSFARLDEVMHLQAEVMSKHGVPINVAEGIMSERISEVERGLHPVNHQRAVDTARLLNIGFLVTHTVCDNMAATFMQKAIDKAKPRYVSDVLKVINSIPEYQIAEKQGAGPLLFAGRPNNYCGKVAVLEFTGGTEGSEKIYEKFAQAGIGTVIGMHLREKNLQEASKHHINIVVAGHMSSDSLGMNLMLDQLASRGVEIVPASGLIRVSRNKKASKSKSKK